MSKYAQVNVKFGADISQFSTAMQNAAREMKKAGDQLKNVGQSMTMNLTAPIVALGAAALYSFGQIDSLKRGLISFSGSAQLAEEEFTKLREVAKLPGIGLEEAVRGSINLQAIGLSADDARKAMSSFGNAIATVGGGKESFDLAIRGFSQLTNASKPLQQDLYQIANQLPQVNKLMIEAFGTNRAEDLAKMGISGKQLAEFLVTELEKLPKVSGGIKNSFENMSDSVKISLASFGESIEKNFNISGKINEISSMITKLINSFANLNPETQKFILSVIGTVAAIGPLLLGLGALIKLLPTFLVGLKAVTNAFALAKTAIVAFSTPMAAMPALFLGILGAVGLAIVAMTNWGDSTSEATKRLKEQREETERLRLEQEKLNNPLLNKKKANPLEGIDLFGKGSGYDAFRKKGFEGGGGEFIFMGDISEPAKKIAKQSKLTQEEIDKANKLLAEAKDRQIKAWNDFYSVKGQTDKDLSSQLISTNNEIQRIEEGKIKIIGTGWDNSTTAYKKGVAGFTSQMAIAKGQILQNMESLTADLNRIIETGLEDTLVNLFSVLGENLVDQDPFKDLGNVLLSSFGKVMQQMGAAMIAWGISLKLLQENFANPYIAIAAGIGLVAAGAAINKIGQNGIKGANSNPSGSYSGGVSSSQGNDLVLSTRLDGRDLILSGQTTSYVKRR